MSRSIWLGLAFAMTMTAAHAVETMKWTYIQAPTPADITPVTSITDTNGIWVGGDVDDAPVIARYSSDGTFRF